MKAYKITYDVRDGDHEYVQHLFFSAGDELTEEVRMFGHQLFLEEAVPDGALLLDDGGPVGGVFAMGVPTSSTASSRSRRWCCLTQTGTITDSHLYAYGDAR